MLDRFEIKELIARSAVASIFKAVDTGSGATVALKIPHPQLESDVALYERFRREEEMGQRLEHPNIVKVFAPAHKSQAYVVMEYVEGPTLREVLRERKKLPAAEALEIARQLGSGLAYLHGHGIVHRSLTPEHIVLTPGGKVKIIELGIALDQSARRLTWGGGATPAGPPDYLAPEQIQGKRGDARIDVYACGAILYEMLCGEVPFPGPKAYSLVSTAMAADPRRPSQLEPGIDPALEAIVLKCLQRSPGDRYGSAVELLQALRDPAAAAAVAAHATAAEPGRGVRWFPRRAVPFVIAAVLAALTLLVWLSSHPGVSAR